MPNYQLPAVCDVSLTNVCNAACDFCGFARDKTLAGPARDLDPGLRAHSGLSRPVAFITALLAAATPARIAMAQSANSNAGLYGGQDGLFDAILATPNRKTPVPQGNTFATAPDAAQVVPTPHSKTNEIVMPPVKNSVSPGEHR